MSTGLMQGKRGLIMGLANDKSIAWGIAKAVAAEGAELAFSYQGEALLKRVQPLAAELGSTEIVECDVADEGSLDRLFEHLQKIWGKLDFVVHAIGFSDKNELRGRYVDTGPENFRMTMDISVYSFTAVCQRAAAMMPNGGHNRVELAVCSIPALLAMKGHALNGRLKQKDAYDVYFCVRNYPDGIEALASACRPFRWDCSPP